MSKTKMEKLEVEKMYTSALNLSKSGKVNEAIKLLKVIGDKYFVDQLSVLTTPSERQIIHDELNDAITNKSARYLYGVEKYEIEEVKFCLLDLLNLLTNDSTAMFYPLHNDFNYKSIGEKIKVDESYEKFIPDENSKSFISSFSWHKELLNLSILTKIDGVVQLKPGIILDNKLISKPSSLSNEFKCHQWKNYCLIENGKLNVDNLPITASKETLDILKENGLILGDIDINKIYVLDLTTLAIVDDGLLKNKFYAKDLIKDSLDEIHLLSEQKFLNSLRKTLIHTREYKNGWDENETEYLLACGFKKDGSYSPPVILEEKDKKEVIAFKVSIKGLSSIPSFDDYMARKEAINLAVKKMETPPVYTMPMKLMLDINNRYQTETRNLALEEKIEWIDSTLIKIKTKLKTIKNEIQKLKFILLLGQSWFTDLMCNGSEQTIDIDTNLILGERSVTGIIRIHKVEI